LTPFPFPTPATRKRQKFELGEQLDAHRKRQQAAHPDLTLTGMYNVLEKLRSGEVLTPKERTIHEHGLVSVLRQLHDDLDAAVLDAYGWSDLLPLLRVAHGNDTAVASLLPPGEGGAQRRMRAGELQPTETSLQADALRPHPPSGHLLPVGEGKADAKRAFDDAILERLVALNAERAAEEARGLIRWLRPDFQNPTAQVAPQQAEIDTRNEDDEPITAPLATAKPHPWPKDTVEQVRAVADLLTASPVALTLDDIAARFTARGPWKKRLPRLLDMLVAIGRAYQQDGRYTAA